MAGFATAAAVAVVLLALLWTFQRRLIYFPFGNPGVPSRSGLPGAEEITFATEDGLTLAGWFVPAVAVPSRGAVVVLNGNAGNRAFRSPLAAALSGAGFAVLLFDYRGYGGNPGSPSEVGLGRDARAALRWMEARDGVPPGRVVLFGESLGAAVAVDVALERPPAALVLRSPFTSLVDVARRHYPFLPASRLLRDRFPSLERAGDLRSPVLVLAGEADRIVPPKQSRRLYDALPEPKRFVLIPGADHNDLDLLAGPRLLRAVDAFLTEHLPPAGAAATAGTGDGRR